MLWHYFVSRVKQWKSKDYYWCRLQKTMFQHLLQCASPVTRLIPCERRRDFISVSENPSFFCRISKWDFITIIRDKLSDAVWCQHVRMVASVSCRCFSNSGCIFEWVSVHKIKVRALYIIDTIRLYEVTPVHNASACFAGGLTYAALFALDIPYIWCILGSISVTVLLRIASLHWGVKVDLFRKRTPRPN